MGQVTVGAAVIGCKRLIMGRVSLGSGLRSEMRGSGEDAGSRVLGGLRFGAGDDRDLSYSEGTTWVSPTPRVGVAVVQSLTGRGQHASNGRPETAAT